LYPNKDLAFYLLFKMFLCTLCTKIASAKVAAKQFVQLEIFSAAAAGYQVAAARFQIARVGLIQAL